MYTNSSMYIYMCVPRETLTVPPDSVSRRDTRLLSLCVLPLPLSFLLPVAEEPRGRTAPVTPTSLATWHAVSKESPVTIVTRQPAVSVSSRICHVCTYVYECRVEKLFRNDIDLAALYRVLRISQIENSSNR